MDLYQILTLVFGLATGILAIICGFLFFSWISPARNTFARYFVLAKRNKKHVSFKWAGNHWKAFICDDETEPDGYWVTEGGRTDIITPSSIGMTMGNVKLAVGDFESMKQINVAMADIITRVAKEGLLPEEMRAAIFAVERTKTSGEDINVAYAEEFAKALKEAKYNDNFIQTKLQDLQERYASLLDESEKNKKKPVKAAPSYPPAGPGQVPRADNRSSGKKKKGGKT